MRLAAGSIRIAATCATSSLDEIELKEVTVTPESSRR